MKSVGVYKFRLTQLWVAHGDKGGAIREKPANRTGRLESKWKHRIRSGFARGPASKDTCTGLLHALLIAGIEAPSKINERRTLRPSIRQINISWSFPIWTAFPTPRSRPPKDSPRGAVYLPWKLSKGVVELWVRRRSCADVFCRMTGGSQVGSASCERSKSVSVLELTWSGPGAPSRPNRYRPCASTTLADYVRDLVDPLRGVLIFFGGASWGPAAGGRFLGVSAQRT